MTEHNSLVGRLRTFAMMGERVCGRTWAVLHVRLAPVHAMGPCACEPQGRMRAQAMNRAVLAGQLLARVLASGAHGERPVTLIGYSMGARYASLHTA